MYYIRFYVKNHKMYCKSLGGAKIPKKDKSSFLQRFEDIKDGGGDDCKGMTIIIHLVLMTE